VNRFDNGIGCGCQKPIDQMGTANALIDRPERTLDSIEIDQCIADTLDRKAMRIEIERRAGWTNAMTNVAEFTAGLEN
jgi:hypothetical protein